MFWPTQNPWNRSSVQDSSSMSTTTGNQRNAATSALISPATKLHNQKALDLVEQRHIPLNDIVKFIPESNSLPIEEIESTHIPAKYVIKNEFIWMFPPLLESIMKSRVKNDKNAVLTIFNVSLSNDNSFTLKWILEEQWTDAVEEEEIWSVSYDFDTSVIKNYLPDQEDVDTDVEELLDSQAQEIIDEDYNVVRAQQRQKAEHDASEKVLEKETLDEINFEDMNQRINDQAHERDEYDALIDDQGPEWDAYDEYVK